MLVVGKIKRDDAPRDLRCHLRHVGIDKSIIGGLKITRVQPVDRAGADQHHGDDSIGNEAKPVLSVR